MKKYLVFIFLLATTATAFSQQKPAYILYNSEGKKVSYKKMINQLAKKDIVLFGEFHNNAIAHWLELSVAKDLLANVSTVFVKNMDVIWHSFLSRASF